MQGMIKYFLFILVIAVLIWIGWKSGYNYGYAKGCCMDEKRVPSPANSNIR